jgi:hypothetical protein
MHPKGQSFGPKGVPGGRGRWLNFASPAAADGGGGGGKGLAWGGMVTESSVGVWRYTRGLCRDGIGS